MSRWMSIAYHVCFLFLQAIVDQGRIVRHMPTTFMSKLHFKLGGIVDLVCPQCNTTVIVEIGGQATVDLEHLEAVIKIVHKCPGKRALDDLFGFDGEVVLAQQCYIEERTCLHCSNRFSGVGWQDCLLGPEIGWTFSGAVCPGLLGPEIGWTLSGEVCPVIDWRRDERDKNPNR